MPDVPSFDEFALDREEQAIVDLLSRLIGEGPASFFRDACRLVRQNPKLASLSNLLAHLAREIDSAVEALLVDPTALQARAEERCEACGAVVTEDKCDSCGTSRRATHKEKKLSVLRRWGIADDDPMAITWLSEESLAKYAHRRRYEPPRPVDEEFLERFQRAKRTFLWLLQHFEDEFLTRLKPTIAAAVQKGPKRGGVKELLALPFTLVVHRYMFLALDSADWIEPLVKAGFFLWPPSASADPDWNHVFPAWPQSSYLAKFALESPDAVCDAVLSIPDTDNPWIILDIFEVAEILPIELVVQLLPKLLDCLGHPISMPWREALPVMRRLMEAGREVEAMKLAVAALGPSWEQSGMALDELSVAIDLLSVDMAPDELKSDAAQPLARLQERQWMAESSHAYPVRPESPLSEEAVEAMTIEEVAAYAVTWRPKGDKFDSPSERGLAESVCRLVDRQPSEWARHAQLFVGAPSEFAGWFLAAFVDALRREVDLEWESLLEYAQAIVLEEPRDDGHWARQEAGALLEEGLRRASSGLTPDLRSQVWPLLRRLAADPHPTPSDEAEFGSDDPFAYSLNSVRGKAVHALFAYLAFVQRALSGDSLRLEEDAPEVAAELEGLLGAEGDDSPTVRAAIGAYWPWLHSLDVGWALGHSEVVFPLGDEGSALRQPAWEAFVSRNRPAVAFYKAYHDAYLKGAAELGAFLPSNARSNYHARFAEHVGLLLLWCAVDPRQEDAVLATFLEESPVDTRRALVGFLGRCLMEVKDLPVGHSGRIGEEALEKLVRLLDQRLENTTESPAEAARELEGFGLWLVSGLFDDEWTLERLVAIARLGGSMERPDLVGGALARLFSGHPALVLEACSGLLEGRSATLVFRGRRPEILGILEVAEASEDNAIAAAGHQLRNRLVARGFIAYGTEG